MDARQLLFDKISKELDRAYAKHGKAPWSKHEFYAILLEEVDELWEAIRKDMPLKEVVDELTQVAAMCVRYAETDRAIGGVLSDSAVVPSATGCCERPSRGGSVCCNCPLR